MGEMRQYDLRSFGEEISAVTASPSENLGAERLWKGEMYRYCYNAGGGTLSQNHGCKLVTGASGYSVAMTSLTDIFSPCVGVAVHTAIVAGSYGWVMTKGFAIVKTSNSVITADYVALGLAADGGFGQLAEGAQIPANQVAGYGLNVDTASAGSMYCFIKTGF